MKGFTQQSFYSKSEEIQKAIILGWAIAVLELNEDVSEDAECTIEKVRTKENGSFAIDYTWTAGQKEVYPAYRDSDTGNWMGAEYEPVESSETFIFHPFNDKDAAFDFHNALTENAKYDEEFDGTNETDGDDQDD